MIDRYLQDSFFLLCPLVTKESPPWRPDVMFFLFEISAQFDVAEFVVGKLQQSRLRIHRMDQHNR